MKAVVVAPVRLLGEGLAQSLNRRPEISVVAVAADLSALRQTLSDVDIDIVLIDVTQAIDLNEVRAIAAERPSWRWWPLGRRSGAMRRGRAAFSGYVARDGTIDELRDAMVQAVTSRLAGPAKKPAGLLRRWFGWMRRP